MPPKSRGKRPAEGLALLGLAQRAGAVARGGEATRRAIRKGEARLVVLAEDASRTQLDKILKTMKGRSVDRRFVPSGSQLGAALGVAPLSAVAVTKRAFARQLARTLESDGGTAVSTHSK